MIGFLSSYEISDKTLRETKKTLKKVHGREFNDEEVRKVAELMNRFARIALDVALEGERRKQKLLEFPKGYHLDKTGYSCMICRHPAGGEDSWYDGYGLKCMTCQGAIDRKEIPGSVARNSDSYYTVYDLDYYFNLKSKVLREWIRKGIIKVRSISGEGKRVHYQLFLLKDNKGLLPPKKMLKSGTIIETIDGKEYEVTKPWYYFCDPFVYLKKYRIMQYMKLKESEPERTGTDNNKP